MSGELIALFSAFWWALGSVLITWGARRIHVVPLNLIRCVVSTTFFWCLLPFYGGFGALAAIPSSAWIWLLVSVLALLVVGDSLYFRSMDLSGVSWAMPVAGTNPLWAVLLAALFLGEPLTWPLLLGALLVIGGVVMVSRSTGQVSLDRPSEPGARRAGLLLALLVSVLWAVGLVALRPATEGMHSVVANSIRQPVAMLMLLGLSGIQGRWRELKGLDRRSWVVIILASLAGTGVATLFFVMAVQMAGAGRTAVLTASSPLLAMPFSILWLRERPTRWTMAGTLLTLAGIALVV